MRSEVCSIESTTDTNDKLPLLAYNTSHKILTTRMVRLSLLGCSPNLAVKAPGVISRISLGTMYPLLFNMAETVL